MTLERFKKFFKIQCPPSIKQLPGTGQRVPFVGMGTTDKVYLSNGDKGTRGSKRREIKGHWIAAADATGKHVFLFSGRPLAGRMKRVGYFDLPVDGANAKSIGFALETHYVPPADVEAAGTPKAGSHWRHIHGVDDEKKGIPRHKLHLPLVYADRNGKVDSESNFIYGSTPTGKITDWMYG